MSFRNSLLVLSILAWPVNPEIIAASKAAIPSVAASWR